MRFERTPGQEPVPLWRRRLVLTLALFAFACALVVQSPGWAQTSYMALSKGNRSRGCGSGWQRRRDRLTVEVGGDRGGQVVVQAAAL